MDASLFRFITVAATSTDPFAPATPLLSHDVRPGQRYSACGLDYKRGGIWTALHYNCPFCKKVNAAHFWQRPRLRREISALLR